MQEGVNVCSEELKSASGARRSSRELACTACDFARELYEIVCGLCEFACAPCRIACAPCEFERELCEFVRELYEFVCELYEFVWVVCDFVCVACEFVRVACVRERIAAERTAAALLGIAVIATRGSRNREWSPTLYFVMTMLSRILTKSLPDSS